MQKDYELCKEAANKIAKCCYNQGERQLRLCECAANKDSCSLSSMCFTYCPNCERRGPQRLCSSLETIEDVTGPTTCGAIRTEQHQATALNLGVCFFFDVALGLCFPILEHVDSGGWVDVAPCSVASHGDLNGSSCKYE